MCQVCIYIGINYISFYFVPSKNYGFFLVAFGFLNFQHFSKNSSISQSDMPMKQNPTNTPNVPPTFPIKDHKFMIKYSVLTFLKSFSDMEFFVTLGEANPKAKTPGMQGQLSGRQSI